MINFMEFDPAVGSAASSTMQAMVGGAAYMLPTALYWGHARKEANNGGSKLKFALANLLLGWTVVGWAGCLLRGAMPNNSIRPTFMGGHRLRPQRSHRATHLLRSGRPLFPFFQPRRELATGQPNAHRIGPAMRLARGPASRDVATRRRGREAIAKLNKQQTSLQVQINAHRSRLGLPTAPVAKPAMTSLSAA